jgi:hypothetical protein
MGSNPLVATKAKGKKLGKQAKEKGKVPKPKGKKQTKEKGKKNDVLFESPAMHIRSKKFDPCNLAMSTTSKRRLSS